MLKIGIIGEGKNVDQSIQQITMAENCQFQGYYNARSSESKGKKFHELDELIEKSDAFCILNPIDNAERVEKLVRHQKHCLIESPFAPSSEAGSYFIDLVREADVKIHVSNPNRYNDAFHHTSPYFQHPVFIESHRLHTYSKETKNLSLVMNSMIHDIDTILNVVKSSIKNVYATGVAVVSKEADIVNARIEFDNGCIANLTASRINPVREHKVNFYQQNDFINVDYLNKKSTVFDLSSKKKGKMSDKELLNSVYSFNSKKKTSHLNEVAFFVDSIAKNTPNISMANCLTALEAAYSIEEKVKKVLA